ncbi:hypothetical protein Rt10032_c24g6700 [Rhodotorula toruloides]|uniref:DUF6534 domain-containing protein n=1 Tax=Rhodotorula toruloides TaxID=5286 RepID=A0A511KQQ3_RHOTO|nr:hypothetical protein Rt10032_c24g6700 [Rhodotorula toruloides]
MSVIPMDAGKGLTDPAQIAAAAAAQQKFFVVQFGVPILLATTLSCFGAGLVLSTILTYFSRYGKSDRWAFRILVGYFLPALFGDTGTQIAWCYGYTITSQLDPASVLLMPKCFAAYTVLTAITVFAAQIFFNWRIWVISGRTQWPLCGTICFIQLGSLTCGCYMLYEMSVKKQFSEFGQVRQAPWAWLGAGLFTDILITAGMVYYLLVVPRLNGTNARQHQVVQSPLRRLAIQSFQTNFLSLCIQTTSLVLMVMKITTFHYSISGFQEAKIYIASVVISLNSRHSTSDHSAHFTESNPTASGRSKGFGSRFHRSSIGTGIGTQQQQQSLHVHVEREQQVEVGEAERPYTVKFDRADSDWGSAEKGDVELGRLGDVSMNEKI